MNLNWSELRALNGSQETGFEELCSQLARLETPSGAEFVRKGSPDGGVECFCKFENGKEWGWQAKFFRTALTNSQWRQLDDSVKAALDTHPNLIRYFVCVPRNRSDSPRPNVTTEMQKWKDHVAKWEGWARKREIEVEFVWWGESELFKRLSREDQAGRCQFWFGTPGQFNAEWFDGCLERAIQGAGPRYTPEVHVDVPLVKDFELFGRSESAVLEIRDRAKDIRRASIHRLPSLVEEEVSALRSVVELSDRIVDSLCEMRCSPNEHWPLSKTIQDILNVFSQLKECNTQLSALADEYKQRDNSSETSYSNRMNPYKEAVHQARVLENVLWQVRSKLEQIDLVINSELMIVTGEAGSGKTHLLCDIARRRLDDQHPTVLLMGQQFTTTESPWIQARAQLGLEDLTVKQFVGALEAAAQAAKCRVLFMIDAINEGEGQAIWPPHLASFLHDLTASPWIGVVLSVRTPFIDHVVSKEVRKRESAYEMEHHGFADNTYAAVQRFCEYYDLDFPATPLLRPEFNNPLFLKMLCEGRKNSQEQRIPVGAVGINKVFHEYLQAIDRDLAQKLDYDPQSKVVVQALDAVASEMVNRGTRRLSKQRVKKLVDQFIPTNKFSHSLYRALVDNGLLMEQPGYEDEWIVHFGYQWFADHLIAECLINYYEDANDLISALAGDDVDNSTVAWTTWNTPLDALSILMPERLGVELPVAVGEGHIYLCTHNWLFRLCTHNWLFRLVGQRFEKPYTRGHCYSRAYHAAWGLEGSWVHRYISPFGDLGDPDIRRAFLNSLRWRDSTNFGSNCRKLVDDLLATVQDSNSVDDWVLVEIFDALVACAVIPNHPLGVTFLDEHLRHLSMPDRDTVWSRYLYFAYGAGGPVDRLLDWTEKHIGYATVSDRETMEACATVLAWFLTSSHRSVRDRATKGLVALLADDLELACDLVQRFNDVDDLYVRERVMAAAYGAAMRNTDAQALAPLADLVYRLIFADDEPPAHILLRDYARGIIERAEYLGAEIAVDDMTLVEPPYHSTWPDIPKASELEKLDPRNRDPQSDLSDADRAQAHIYSSVMAWDFARFAEPTWQSVREVNEPRLSLDIIQRYVLWRTFDLGWTIDRFGDLDWHIYRSNGGDLRGSGKPERIGKKYQWIAYHEILAYISDHCQYHVPYADAQPQNEYRGTWQLSVRDIDPSMIHTGELPGEEASEGSIEWCNREIKVASINEMNHEEWLRCEDDLPDVEQQLRFTNPEDGSTWIKLQGANTWDSQTIPGYDPHEVDWRNIFLQVCGYFINTTETVDFIEWSKTVNFYGRWMPEPPKVYPLFFGELGCSSAFDAMLGNFMESQYPEFRDGTRCPASLQLVAIEYLAEQGGYDCSLVDSYTLYRPHSSLVNAMNLRWTGYGADFVDDYGVRVTFDPSAHDTCSSSLLIREESLERFLNETNLALVWAIVGEKLVVPGDFQKRWPDFLKITGAASYRLGHLDGYFTTNLEIVDLNR